jgi:hypothetical protein
MGCRITPMGQCSAIESGLWASYIAGLLIATRIGSPVGLNRVKAVGHRHNDGGSSIAVTFVAHCGRLGIRIFGGRRPDGPADIQRRAPLREKGPA